MRSGNVPTISVKRSNGNQPSYKRIGRGIYAASDDGKSEAPPPLHFNQRSIASTRSHSSHQQPTRRYDDHSLKSSTSNSLNSFKDSTNSKHSRHRRRGSSDSGSSSKSSSSSSTKRKPGFSEMEVRNAITNTLKDLGIVPDHVQDLAIDEAVREMQNNRPHGFPPVRSMTERYMPREEVQRLMERDNLRVDHQFLKVKSLLLNITAMTRTVCKLFNLDQIHTKYLHECMENYVNNKENRYIFDEYGRLIKDTFLDHCAITMGSGIIGVFRESYEKEERELRPPPPQPQQQTLPPIVEEPEIDLQAKAQAERQKAQADLANFKARHAASSQKVEPSPIVNQFPPSLMNHNVNFEKKKMNLTSPQLPMRQPPPINQNQNQEHQPTVITVTTITEEPLLHNTTPSKVEEI